MIGVLGPGSLAIGPEFIAGGTATLPTTATNDSYECVLRLREAITITQLGCGISIRTGTPPTYEISLQGVNSSGRADGTIKSSGNAKATFTPPADTTWNATFQWFTLTSSYACSRGELVAIVVKYSSGTINVSNRTTFRTRAAGATANFPYLYEVPAGVATLRNAFPVIGYRSATASYGLPLANATALAYNSDSVPDERGVKFTLPGTGQYMVSGVRMFFGPPVLTKTGTLLFYDSDGTSVLTSILLTGEQSGSIVSASAHYYFPGVVTVTGGQAYRIALRPEESTTACSISLALFSNAQDALAVSGETLLVYTTRTDAGGWTDDSLTVPCMLPLIETMTSSGQNRASAPSGLSSM